MGPETDTWPGDRGRARCGNQALGGFQLESSEAPRGRGRIQTPRDPYGAGHQERDSWSVQGVTREQRRPGEASPSSERAHSGVPCGGHETGVAGAAASI